MIKVVLVLVLLQISTMLYDTVLVGNTTYIDLRIGEFKKIALPFNFTTYYSVDTGKTEVSSQLNIITDVCSVDERQFDLQQLDYLGISGKGMMFKNVITQYQTLLQRRFLVDMMVLDNILFAVYVDNIRVISLNVSDDSVGSIIKSINLTEQISTGKLIKASKQLLYFVGPKVVYKINKEGAVKLQGYNLTQDSFESAAMSNQNTLLIASGKTGVHVYSIDNIQITHLMLLDKDFFKRFVDFSDIQSDGQYVYLLDRLKSIIKLNVNATNISTSFFYQYQIASSGCQNLQYFQDQIYITCPQLHRITFFGDDIIDKAFENPNFNPKSIIYFNSIIIVVGHNLAKIYNRGVQLGYYHDFLMRKLIPYGDKILIGSDYGISLTKWNVDQLQITCGLKRKGVTQKYEGIVSTTINVVAQCNQKYFKQNNIDYKQQLKNDVCLYHFPISIDFWIGRQINYLPFKIGVGVILVVSLLVLVGWFLLNTKVKNLTDAIKHYSSLTQTQRSRDGTVPYENMVEQNDGNVDKQSNEQQMHDIGD